MGDDTKVDTDISTEGKGILLATAILFGGVVYVASRYNMGLNSVPNFLAMATLSILALSLWQFLTNHEGFTKIIANEQMLTIIATCIISASYLFTLLDYWKVNYDYGKAVGRTSLD